jgi:hypothetical protein
VGNSSVLARSRHRHAQPQNPSQTTNKTTTPAAKDKTNKFCTVYQIAPAPQGIGSGSFAIYDVMGQINKKDGKEQSSITGVLVVPEDKRYKFVKVSAEVTSKSQGIIKCTSDVDLNKNDTSIKDAIKIPGRIYTSFEWPTPTDIDLSSLHITNTEAR